MIAQRDLARLFEQRLDTLYRFDAAGRMIATNEWQSRPAPHFHLMMTALGPQCRFGPEVSDDVARRLSALAAEEPPDQPLRAAPSARARYLEVLAASDGPGVWAGPAYLCSSDVRDGAGAVAIDDGNAHLLEPRFPDWLADVPHRRPFLAVIADGAVASLCASVRISRQVHCAGVETHPDFRRRGFALAAVSAWARAVRALGAAAFYSTSWDNLASRGVAQRLGLALVAADFHVSSMVAH
jgi:hypothetical protein